jgi:hypothetical protein
MSEKIDFRQIELPMTYETDYKNPCEFCTCDHTHIAIIKDITYRICYDCGFGRLEK